MKLQVLLATALSALSLAVAAPAYAQVPDAEVDMVAAGPELMPLPGVDPAAAALPVAVELEPGELLTDGDLSELRGGQTIVLGNQTLNAITSGNSLKGDYTAGNVTLSDNALSAFTGMGNFAINTGAQVSLQSGMNVVINVGD